MKLNYFKFQDGKVFWLPEYPDSKPVYPVGYDEDDECYSDYEDKLNAYDQAVAQSLASAIEVALEDEDEIFKLLWWQTEKSKVYSAECEMEIELERCHGQNRCNKAAKSPHIAPCPHRCEQPGQVARLKPKDEDYLKIPSGTAIKRAKAKLLEKAGLPEDFPWPAKEHLPKPYESNRDWPEDYSQENGNYQNKCCLCGLFFYGNKHRVVCKQCQEKIEHDESKIIPIIEIRDAVIQLREEKGMPTWLYGALLKFTDTESQDKLWADFPSVNICSCGCGQLTEGSINELKSKFHLTLK